MNTASADLPPYDPQRMVDAPFPERIRLACVTWANASPNRPSVMALYWLKYFFPLIGGWAFWCSFNAGYPGFFSFGEWAFTGDAFQKAMVWSIFWELAGFGCGWGPMNARFDPWFGGYRHFLRRGTIKLPLFPGAPMVGAQTRGWLDVAVYGAVQLFLLRALIASHVTPELLYPLVLLIPLMGVLDKTLYLAARGEHYFVVLVCLALLPGELWISGAKLVWCFIWFWAATSKLNRHFPSVIMFMMNNGPFFPKALKKNLFTSFPTDLRPSNFAAFMAHFGTLVEYSLPVILVFGAGNEAVTIFGLLLMTAFHGWIGINNPNGMPVEWNILMIYGGWFLFGFHPEASLSALTAAPFLLTLMLLSLAVVPTIGNFFPAKVSFLLSMRYYAGNWAYNIWLVRKGNAVEKFDKLKKVSGTAHAQLAKFVPDPLHFEVAKIMMCTSRFMHFEGRALLEALPRATDDIEDYDWHEGELIGGMILGWNFGDGHLNGEQLLRAIQPQCGFSEGEVRLVSVESQPLFGPTMHWRVYDAARGLVAEGHTKLADYVDVQPYPTGQFAEALRRGRRAAG